MSMFTKDNIFTDGEYSGFLKHMYENGHIDLRGCPFIESIPNITQVVGMESSRRSRLVFADEENNAALVSNRPYDLPPQDDPIFVSALEQARLCMLAYLN